MRMHVSTRTHTQNTQNQAKLIKKKNGNRCYFKTSNSPVPQSLEVFSLLARPYVYPEMGSLVRGPAHIDTVTSALSGTCYSLRVPVALSSWLFVTVLPLLIFHSLQDIFFLCRLLAHILLYFIIVDSQHFSNFLRPFKILITCLTYHMVLSKSESWISLNMKLNYRSRC